MTLRRRSGIARRKPVAKRNAKRRKSEFARCYHSEERVLWVKSQPCALAGCIISRRGAPSENAHAHGDGMGRKASYESILPLCDLHHRQLHLCGVRAFEDTHKVNLLVLAARTHAAWLASTTETTL